MAVIAKLNYLRIAPRKVRLVADLIRGKKVEKAQNILNFTTKKAAGVLLKLLKSAIANAKHNFQLEESNLYVSKITIDEGPKLKRWMPRARGQASEIQKKTSHVTLILDEIKKEPRKIKKVKKVKKLRPPRRPPKGPLVEKIETVPKVEKPPKEGLQSPTGQAKLRPELEIPKPKIERGIRRVFRRKAF